MILCEGFKSVHFVSLYRRLCRSFYLLELDTYLPSISLQEILQGGGIELISGVDSVLLQSIGELALNNLDWSGKHRDSIKETGEALV